MLGIRALLERAQTKKQLHTELQNESSKVTLPSSMNPKQVNSTTNNETPSTSDAPTDLNDTHTIRTQQSSLNFSTDVSAECLTALVGSQPKMSNKDLSKVLKFPKHNGDTRIPTKKNEMIRTYEEWKERKPLEFDTDDEFVSVSDSKIEIGANNEPHVK